MSIVSVPVPFGDLIDKITILEIKLERLDDPKKLANVRKEFQMLQEIVASQGGVTAAVFELQKNLKTVNGKIWDLEDAVRDCERKLEFGPDFVQIARAIYRTNDRRAALKRQINSEVGSPLVEEKSYAEY